MSKRRRVFMLGAGFSASAGVPVLNDILPALLSFGNKPEYVEAQKALHNEETLPPHPAAFLEFMVRQYHEFNKGTEVAGRYPNLEDLMTYLDEYQEIQFMTSSIDILWATQEGFHPINDLLAEFLWSFTKHQTITPPIRDFCSLLSDKDVVITMNWDNLLERTLFLSGTRFETLIHRTRPPRDDEPEIRQKYVRLLKLHGSIDWRDGDAEEMSGHVREARSKGWDVFLPKALGQRPVWWNSPAPQCAGVRVRLPLETGEFDHCWMKGLGDPILVFPTSRKRFEDTYLWDQWTHARRALERADEIIIIGYSLPDADKQVRLLMRASIENEERKTPPHVSVVNPDASVLARARRIHDAAELCASDLREFVMKSR